MRPGKNWPYLPDFVASACKVLAIKFERLRCSASAIWSILSTRLEGRLMEIWVTPLTCVDWRVFLDFLGIRIVTIGLTGLVAK